MSQQVLSLINSLVERRTLPQSLLFFTDNSPDVLFKEALGLASQWFGRSFDNDTINTFSDLIVVDQETKTLKIEDIRNLQERIKYGPSETETMIVIVPGCERLTPQSSNALLKTIEEPPKGVHFIFLTHQKAKVLPTILSRSQPLFIPSQKVPSPSADSYQNWQVLAPFEQYLYLQTLSKDKERTKQVLYGWLEELKTTASPQTQDIISTLKRLEYNVNTTLQAEHLFTSLRL